MVLRKRGRAPRVEGAAPVELLDVDDPAWADVAATQAWARDQGLSLNVVPYGPVSRHRVAMNAWAAAEVLTRPVNASSDRTVPDWAALRSLGIPAYGSARHIEERLSHAEVAVDR